MKEKREKNWARELREREKISLNENSGLNEKHKAMLARVRWHEWKIGQKRKDEYLNICSLHIPSFLSPIFLTFLFFFIFHWWKYGTNWWMNFFSCAYLSFSLSLFFFLSWMNFSYSFLIRLLKWIEANFSFML